MKTILLRLATLVAVVAVAVVVVPKNFHNQVHADDAVHCEDQSNPDDSADRLQKKIDDCQAKINDASQQAETLSKAITVLNSQISLNQAQIDKTKVQINDLEHQIDDLGQRISGLEISLNDLSKVLVDRIQEQYKQAQADPVTLFLASTGISQFIQKQRYVQQARAHTEDLMLSTEYKRQVYNDEKDQKQQKQDEVQVLKNKLDSQQATLSQQRADKQKLLTLTKNNEQNYQKLLSQAQSELASFSGFTSSQGGGVLPAQPSPDGWFFSQRDERWANSTISSSRSTIMEVGCLVTATAMVKKKYGDDVTPLSIAKNSGYFFSNTAYMLQPWPAPSGKHYEISGYSQSKLDAEMAAGRPVIVHLQVNTRDGHFVVIKSGSGGSYQMNDPWEGYDKKFSDFYRTGEIVAMGVLR